MKDKTSNLPVTSISGMDASFLYLDTDNSPMHIGGVSIVEGNVDFEKFRSIILSRIHMVPQLRKKLNYLPMNFDFPFWADDPDFDIDMHLHHIALPKPGNWESLRKMSSKIFSNPLDHSRPLWSFTFVEGLNNMPNVPKGSSAVISKIHHVAVDGVGGAGLLGLLFDFASDVQKIPEPKPYKPEPIPNDIKMMVKGTSDLVGRALKIPKVFSQTLMATFKAGLWTTNKLFDPPTVPFTAPKSHFNKTISSHREWDAIEVPLERLKAMKKKVDSTLNDVILAICSGALRRYLLEKNQLPQDSLIAMVPISTRNEGKESEGNQLSSMLIKLATNQENPLSRLESIIENTSREKKYQGDMGSKTLANLAETVPFGMASYISNLYSKFKLSNLHKPVFNVTITNVPGPPFGLYLHGKKLKSIMGMAPIVDGMGLMITIFSYDGNITISATSDSKTLPDITVFSRYLMESLEELEREIPNYNKRFVENVKVLAKPGSDAIFAHIKKHLKLNAEFIKPNNGLFQFIITGSSETKWKIDLNKSPGVVRRGGVKDPDAVFTIKDEHFVKIGKGKLNFQTAFIQGRLKIDGDSAKSMKLGTILSKLPKME